MALIPFTPINVSDQTLALVQDRIEKALDQFTRNVVLGGQLKTVSFSAADSDVFVSHGLNTTNIGYLVGTQNLPGTIFTSPTKPSPTSLILQCESPRTLSASSPLTAQVYIFQKG